MFPLAVKMIHDNTMCILYWLTFHPNSTPKVGYKEMWKYVIGLIKNDIGHIRALPIASLGSILILQQLFPCVVHVFLLRPRYVNFDFWNAVIDEMSIQIGRGELGQSVQFAILMFYELYDTSHEFHENL